MLCAGVSPILVIAQQQCIPIAVLTQFVHSNVCTCKNFDTPVAFASFAINFSASFILYRTIAPVFAGTIYSISLTNGLSFPLNYNLIFMLCANQGSVTIRGLRCAKHGSALCADNPWIVQRLRNPRIAQLNVRGSLKRAGSCIMVDRNDFEESFQLLRTEEDLFAIAFAVCLCEGKDPCKFKWSQEHMRSHLCACLSRQAMSFFPAKSRIASKLNNTLSISVTCSCRMPETRNMFQCSQCAEWFHRKCENISRTVSTSAWQCQKW